MTWPDAPRGDTSTDPYSALADRVAADVIASYSTSFSLATRLLAAPIRRDIRNLYAVVRIADEIVDGAASDVGAGRDEVRTILDDYEARVLAATGGTDGAPFFTDPILHAWSGTASRCRINPEHMVAFFASMRADLDVTVHDADSLASYIHGSAEVIGLMSLDIFLTHESTDADRTWLDDGAIALGRAFQMVNFLRDLGADQDGLGRIYLPELADGPLTGATHDRFLDDIEADLDLARERIPYLPAGARAGVAAAIALYAELAVRIRASDPADLENTRIRVPGPRKALVTAKAVANIRRRRS
ncbi:MAG TPA: squalene/phytoene synthase family protein [Candidatus Corynebacterium avicola]|uniref:Squalene/phytoene synthase family protein n=1 Tax=Candidatus Corynebacterium avicola TaxID=2838527 RepID=A0A9D1UL97_9CORY|nr:squalene/phytoene synthase family protein [Candidatus Corynebacterium avicola]